MKMPSNKDIKKYIVLFLLIVFVVIGFQTTVFAEEHETGTTSAQDDLGYTPLQNLNIDTSDGINLAGYLNAMFKLFLGIASILAVVMIVYAGVQYATSDSESGTTQAKEILNNAIKGLLLALAAWLILYTINPDLLDFNLELKNIEETKVNNNYIPNDGDLPPLPADGVLDFDPGIQAQTAHAAPELSTFLNCMSNELPGNVGRVSSISDSLIVDENYTWQECADGNCEHTANSCHYGGRNCVGESYAVDFGDQENTLEIYDAARKCDMGPFIQNEGDHVHISITAARSKNCGCN